ncbi:glutamate-1-semialdehyde 2,1-aminomutase, partial [Burkholderia pseudomallei]
MRGEPRRTPPRRTDSRRRHSEPTNRQAPPAWKRSDESPAPRAVCREHGRCASRNLP